MKKILAVSMAAVVAFTASGCGRASSSCTKPDGKLACYDAKTKKYLFEEGAKVRIGVDDKKWGAEIVKAWDKAFPELKGKLEFVETGAAGSTDALTQQGKEFPDVFLAIDGEVSRNAQSILQMEANLKKLVESNAVESFYKNTNTIGPVYAPVTYDGMAFAWNKKMIEALKIDTKDANNDLLPDAFDTWEEIFAIGDAWAKTRPTYNGKPVNVVFPLAISEPWSVYHAYTAGGFAMYKDGDASKPGFDKAEFLEGLKFIQEASKHHLSVEANGKDTAGAGMGWRWDDFLKSEISPFGLVGTWMDIAGAEKTLGTDYIFTAVPTYKGKAQTPFVKTKGWVMNSFTKYPSATHEVLRWLYSKEGFQTMVDNSSYAPALKDKSAITPDMSKDVNKQQMMSAFKSNYSEPALTLPNNKNMKAMDGYYNGIKPADFLSAMWDGKMTPEDVQKKYVELYSAWYTTNNK